MAQGPIIIFDKSTLQCLTDDEAVLLDNFYMSNITPVFIAECLADLDRDMESAKSKGSPESMVGSHTDQRLRSPQLAAQSGDSPERRWATADLRLTS